MATVRQHETRIGDTPCKISYVQTPAIRGAREAGVPMEPDLMDGFEILEVLDLDGRPWKALADQMTGEDEDRIFDELEGA